MNLTRYVLPVVAGAMGGMMLITVGEMWIENLYRIPAGAPAQDIPAMATMADMMPVKAFILLLLTYSVCSFSAGIIATVVANRVLMRPAVVVGIVLTLAGLYNVLHLPHPMWFAALNLLVYLPFAWLGYLVARKKSQAA